MQPRHVAAASSTFSDWSSIPQTLSPFQFLAHGDGAATSSPGSNNISPSKYFNSSSSSESPDVAQNAAEMLAVAAGCTTAGPTAGPATAAAKPLCNPLYCANEKCRRQVQLHPRGIVCTTCMSSDKWRQCSSIGCTAVIHAVCTQDPDAAWKCPSCITKASEGLSDVPAAGSTQPEDSNECHIFDSDTDMYTFLRNQGYRLNNTQKSGKTWECRYCSKTFYAKKMKDDRWSCPMTIVHEHNCSRPVKPDVKDDPSNKGLQSIRYFHELGNYPGLLEYIEILGCVGEIRADTLQRAVRKQFNVHVSSALLYRTAKNAHDEMFGSNISDIEELLKMSEEVGNEGGFLKLFTGNHDDAHVMLMLIQQRNFQCIH